MVGSLDFYVISTHVGYLKPNPLYTYRSNIYDLVWFYGLSAMVGLFNAKSYLYIHIYLKHDL